MKLFYVFILFSFVPISAFSQYTYIGHNGEDCSSDMTISYTYNNYSQGSHGGGYYLYRNGETIRWMFEEFGGYSLKSVDFLNDSVGFISEVGQGILRIYRTVDYGNHWEFMGGTSSIFLDVFFVNQHTGYLVGRKHNSSNGIMIERIIKGHQRTVFDINSVTTTTTYYTEIDTIMQEPLCINQQNLTFNIQYSGTDIFFKIDFDHILLSINTFSFNNNLSVYPNPAKDIIYFDLSNKQIKDIAIYDCRGKLLLNQTNDNDSVNISGLSKGIYFLILRGDKDNYRTKFIVE